MFIVKQSPLAPVPHVQVYVPGVTPRLANVWPVQVAVDCNVEPET